MIYTRRQIGKLALGTGLVAGYGVTRKTLQGAAARPNSMFGGVQIGTITYSFRSLPSNAEEVLGYCVDCGISGIELMSEPAEQYAGAPVQPRGGGFGGPPPRPGAMGGPPPGSGAQGAPPTGRAPMEGAPRAPRRELTPEQQEARRQAAEATTKWRLSISMDKYAALRKMYEDAGVKIYAFKLPPTMEMSDDEYDYIWNVGETLGANHITMELPREDQDDLLQRVGEYAAKRRLRIAFHTHGQGGASGFDKALGGSDYTALNFDVGHFWGVNGTSPVPLVEQYHDRIASLHLKDRQSPADGGQNMPWGQGSTPLKDVLQSMKRNGYQFPASIEYEYRTPEGSDVLTEMKKCVEYCRQSLA